MEWSLEETRCKLPRSLWLEGHWGHAQFLQHWVTTHLIYEIYLKCPPGKLIRDSVPKVFTGVWSNIGTLCLTCTNIQTSRRKADVQHKLYCLYKPLRHNKIPLSVREWCEYSQNPSVHNTSQGPAMQAGLSKYSSLRPTMLI